MITETCFVVIVLSYSSFSGVFAGGCFVIV